MCWAISNSNPTWYPNLWWAELKILTKKEPSPDVKPAIHIPKGIDVTFQILSCFVEVERVSAKAAFISSDSPKFNDTFLLTISFNPYTIKCILAFIMERIDFHKV